MGVPGQVFDHRGGMVGHILVVGFDVGGFPSALEAQARALSSALSLVCVRVARGRLVFQMEWGK